MPIGSPITDARTVVARLTPPGRAALATLALAGPDAEAIARRLFSGRWNPERPMYGCFGADVKDDLVVYVSRSGGENATVEIHCHGGPAIAAALLDAIQNEGAKLVDWRAYLERLGVGEIAREAAEAMTRCRTERTAAILLDQYNGALEQAFEEIVALEPADRRRRIEELLRWSRVGMHLTTPWRVALFGRPNVGKSSLLNALSGYERAIVCDMPGTTRDVLGATVALDGWPVELLDGAGLHETPEEIEREGIRRYTEELRTVDLRILVVDLSAGMANPDASLIEMHQPDLIVGNKVDLVQALDRDAGGIDVYCSAATGEGVAELADRIVSKLAPQTPPAGTPVPFTLRQIEWLHRLATGDAEAD